MAAVSSSGNESNDKNGAGSGRRRRPCTEPKPSPPGPTLQAINSALQKEPLTSIFFYGIFWSCFILVSAPFVVFALQITTLFRIITWLTNFNNFRNEHGAPAPPEDLAVVITGCDTGFGRELAMWASSQAGYHVFAGCLREESFEHFVGMEFVTPMKMDVTSDEDVELAVQKVSDWINNRNSDGGDGGKDEKKEKKNHRRVLHALVNNAGMFFGFDIDLTTVSDFQKSMDGKQMCSTVLNIVSYVESFRDVDWLCSN